jgi:hypothetical protein
VSEEIELIAKTSGEVVGALAEESGALALPREYATYFATRVHLRHYPKLIERAMATAEKINASGLPRRAFSALDEPLVTAILEDMAEETEPALQDLWENLLANELTEGSAEVRRAFPRILGELDPEDAHVLDHFARQTSDDRALLDRVDMVDPGERDELALDNLTRVELLRAIRFFQLSMGTLSDAEALVTGYTFTELGWAFVKACHAPQPAD